jgi:hypothetical protein
MVNKKKSQKQENSDKSASISLTDQDTPKTNISTEDLIKIFIQKRENQGKMTLVSKSQEELREEELKKQRIKELKHLVRSKRQEERIKRSSQKIKEKCLEQTFEEYGVDKEKFREDLTAVAKRGGFTVDMKRD